MPAYNVPPTQNTALVLEFRCLYTHDILKKQKKWHDGSLRFHTFNRRVMVYDDVKNYIGDLHYRQDEEFGEGLELQLDRPVKVEVGEPIGQTSTDLRPILNRGRDDRTLEDGVHAPKHTFQRATFVNSSGKPKSLSEVLGLSQGRLGRARIPIHSPYEQRGALMEKRQEEPPAKRPKLAAGKENETCEIPKLSSNIQRSTKSSLLQAQSSVNTSLSEQEQRDLNSAVIEVSSGDAAGLTRKAPVGTIKASKSQKPKKLSQQKPVSNEGTLESAAHHTRNRKSKSPKPRKGHNRTSSIAPKIPIMPQPDLMPNMTSSGSNAILQSEMTTLRLRCQPPRKKLMYKALLPMRPTLAPPCSSDLEESATTFSTKDTSPANSQSTISQNNQNGVSCGDVLYMGSKLHSQPTSKVHLQNHQQPKGSEVRDEKSPGQRPQSPLFFSQGSYQNSPPLTPRFADNEDALFFQSQQHDKSQRTDVISLRELSPCNSDNLLSHDISPLRAKDHLPGSCSSDGVRPSSQVSPAANASVPTLVDATKSYCADSKQSSSPRPSSPVCNSKPIIAHAQSIHSVAQPVSTSISQPKIQISTSGTGFSDAQPENLGSKHTIHGAKTTLGRAHSDLEAVISTLTSVPLNLPSPITSSIQPREEASDCGAWSKLEAFLLFDKWPEAKAKDKPVFHSNNNKATKPFSTVHKLDDAYDGIEDHIVLSMDTSAAPRATTRAGAQVNGTSGRRPTILPGIRSARTMLRNRH